MPDAFAARKAGEPVVLALSRLPPLPRAEGAHLGVEAALVELMQRSDDERHMSPVLLHRSSDIEAHRPLPMQALVSIRSHDVNDGPQGAMVVGDLRTTPGCSRWAVGPLCGSCC
jgi:hypothetical protein